MVTPAQSWRLIRTWAAEPGFNMALDEALLLGTEARPTLRFYTWRPDALSLGYFQRFDEVAGKERAGALVRRLTGGGAIHHARELTFSIVASEEHPLYRGPVAESYDRVHRAIAAALAPLGIRAAPRGDASLASDVEASGMCFHRSTAIDLAWEGRKGVGSAQRRTGGRVLHHGSIKVGHTPLDSGVATVGAHSPAEVADLVQASFAQAFAAAFREEPATDIELAHARERADHFGSEAFLRRR
ncbi:MAG: hypothetical protein O7B99_03570 [Planctomycetota bacterium]|nr:hypothetical protein [Planctomycetota bacterium]